MESKNTKELIFFGISGAVISFFILLAELYYSNYGNIASIGLNFNALDVHFFSKKPAAVLDSGIKIRGIILLFMALLVLYPTVGEKPHKLGYELRSLAGLIIVFLSFVLLINIMPTMLGSLIVIIGSLVVWALLMRNFFRLSRFLNLSREGMSKNAEYADGFQQNKELMESDCSINFTHYFHYKKELHRGHINVINPFRASYVIGTPGSGKSYAVLEEYYRQLIAKNFCGVIYDYKDPTLTELAYSYLQEHKQYTPKNNITFGYISFKQLNKTYRCNPIKNVYSSAEALDVAFSMLVALNKEFANKQGEFFTESAIKYTALNIYALGVLFDGRYQSIPHVISLLCKKASVSFPALKVLSIFYPDMKNLFAPFAEAYEQEVYQQLQGQLASAQIGLGSMSDATLSFIMTEDSDNMSENIDLDVNSFENPKLLCVGSDPNKDKIMGLACSVYLSRLAKKINKKGVPCQYIVDELPTVFINGLDNLIATARSNKIAVLLGFQDYSQLKRDYGDKISNAIINTIGNTFSGAVSGETAKRLSESFGEKKVRKVSESRTDEGKVTKSYSEQKERKIPIDTIEELSQGTFVGRTSDEFDKRVEYKVFHGSIEIDSSVKKINHTIPDIRSWSEEETFYNLQQNAIKIDNQVSDVILAMTSIAEDYSKLKAITLNNPEIDNPYTLENLITNPEDDRSNISLLVWLELAYYIIEMMKTLDLKNDVLSMVDKLELLLRDVYTGGKEGLDLVLNTIRDKNLISLDIVQSEVEKFENNKQDEKFDEIA